MTTNWTLSNVKLDISSIKRLIDLKDKTTLSSFRLFTNDSIMRTVSVGSSSDQSLSDLIKYQVEGITISVEGKKQKVK